MRASQLKRHDVFISEGVEYRVLKNEGSKLQVRMLWSPTPPFNFAVDFTTEIVLTRNLQQSEWGILGRYRPIWKRLLTFNWSTYA